MKELWDNTFDGMKELWDSIMNQSCQYRSVEGLKFLCCHLPREDRQPILNNVEIIEFRKHGLEIAIKEMCSGCEHYKESL